jgi:hypothetical protein
LPFRAERENLKTGGAKVPVEMSRIEELSARIARRHRPERIILFGSYA